MAFKPGPGLAGWEVATIKMLVAEYRHRQRLLRDEQFDDLMQECLAHWIEVRRHLPPGNRGDPPVSYLAQVTRNKLADILRALRAEMRFSVGGTATLDELVEMRGESMTLGEILSDALYSADEDRRITLHFVRQDVRRVVETLTPYQRRLCYLLSQEGVSITAAAELLDRPRKRLYDDIMRIRKVFNKRGLGGYLRW